MGKDSLLNINLTLLNKILLLIQTKRVRVSIRITEIKEVPLKTRKPEKDKGVEALKSDQRNRFPFIIKRLY